MHEKGLFGALFRMSPRDRRSRGDRPEWGLTDPIAPQMGSTRLLCTKIQFWDSNKQKITVLTEYLVLGGHGGTGHRGTQAIKSLPKALELDHYVFISHMSTYYHNLGPIFVAVKGVKIYLFNVPP